MLRTLSERIESFFGRGRASVTVPAMDGAYKPNSRLDSARLVARVHAPDNITVVGEEVLYTSASSLFRVSGGHWETPILVAEFHQPVLALAASASGSLAVALDGVGVRVIGGPFEGRLVAELAGKPLTCVVALAFASEDVVVACNGSARHPASDWQYDLLNAGSSGFVCLLDLAASTGRIVADELGFPYGVLLRGAGTEAIVAESWHSRLLAIDLGGQGRPRRVIEGIPGYPARLSARPQSGAWLSVFAPRNQLIEFVLREKVYRHAMMAEVAPEFWIAPALSSGKSFSEPMQGGALKQMGVLKPWAPTRSYGLVVELGPDLQPMASFHSRAGGSRHGITSCQQFDGELLIASRGGDEIVAIGVKDGQDSGSSS